MQQKYKIIFNLIFTSSETPRKEILISTSVNPSHFTVVDSFLVNGNEFKLEKEPNAPWAEIDNEGKSILFIFPYIRELGKPFSIHSLKKKFEGDKDVKWIANNEMEIKSYKRFVEFLHWMT